MTNFDNTILNFTMKKKLNFNLYNSKKIHYKNINIHWIKKKESAYIQKKKNIYNKNMHADTLMY